MPQTEAGVIVGDAERVDGPTSELDDTRSDEGDYWADKVERQKATKTGLLGDEEYDDDDDDEDDEDEGDGEREELREMLKQAEMAMANLARKFKRNDQVEAQESDESEEESEDSESDSEDSDYLPAGTAGKGRGQGKVQARKPATKGAKKAAKAKPQQIPAKPKESVSEYQFCPPSHRLAILRLFSRHFNQHPLLPERHGQTRTSKEIYHDAVKEMYLHCTRNHLCDVWAYMWVNWYRPKMWHLWARSHYAAAIPQKRTTMEVESLWRNYKRLSMPHHARVAADYSIHLLITETIVAYRQRVRKHTDDDRREGRAKQLTAEQAEFKKAWMTLAKAQIKGSYNTNPNRWTCDCGSQKYNANLLCKHLVQSVPMPHNDWWPEVIRYSVPPFYVVPGVPDPMEPEKLIEYSWRSRQVENSAEPPTVVIQVCSLCISICPLLMRLYSDKGLASKEIHCERTRTKKHCQSQ
jgi:hypothetical protein